MRSYLAPKPAEPTVNSSLHESTHPTEDDSNTEDEPLFTGYFSDQLEDLSDHESDNENLDFEEQGHTSLHCQIDAVDTPPPHPHPETPAPPPASPPSFVLTHQASFRVREPPPSPKRRKLDIPALVSRQRAREKRKKEFADAFVAISKLLRSRKTVFDGGARCLQVRRAQAIESTLSMVVKRKMALMPASEAAAASHGFSPYWGSRMVRSWVREWIKDRSLPESDRGSHAKVWSLLSDPIIRAEIRSYLRSNKWAMSPAKCQSFLNNELLPEKAKEYAKDIATVEMPQGLQKYLEKELLPRFGFKVKKGISYSTAREIIAEEGFMFTEYKKALYFDGHERPDNVDYRQNDFIPAFYRLMPRLVEWKVGDVENKKDKGELPNGERWLVLVAHDEMTAQANDGKKSGWVYKDEQPLKKKGAGRGIHQSDCICSCHGWIEGASQTLEYGKNYEGYWNGELFIKQVRNYTSLMNVYLRFYQSLLKRSSLNLSVCILECRLVFSSTILRAILLMARMPSHEPDEHESRGKASSSA